MSAARSRARATFLLRYTHVLLVDVDTDIRDDFNGFNAMAPQTQCMFRPEWHLVPCGVRGTAKAAAWPAAARRCYLDRYLRAGPPMTCDSLEDRPMKNRIKDHRRCAPPTWCRTNSTHAATARPARRSGRALRGDRLRSLCVGLRTSRRPPQVIDGQPAHEHGSDAVLT